MPTIIRTKNSPHKKEELFNLVANFSDYPQFLPFCDKATSVVISEHEVEGTLFIDKGLFKHSFTTKNTMYPHDKINIELVKGPFKKLQGKWQFSDHLEGCKVELNLSYEIQANYLAPLLGKAFEVMASSMIDAFCKEAERRYATQS